MGGKIRLKGEKGPISLDLEGKILQVVLETLEHFYDEQFTPLVPKIGDKIQITVVLDQFHTVSSTFRLSLPKLWAKFVILLHFPVSFGVNLY